MLELGAAAVRFGTRIAIRVPGAEVSYAELGRLMAAARARFTAAAVSPRCRVALRCQPTPSTIATALALLEQRCTVLPIAADAPSDAVQAPLAAFRPDWEVSEDALVRPQSAEPTGVLATHGDSQASEGDDDDAPLQALLSSGSAGQPKIVLRSVRQVAAGVRIFSSGVELDPDDRVLLMVPLQHSFGFNSVMLGALVIPRSRHPRGIVADLEDGGVTLFPAPPLFFDWMCRFADETPGPRLAVRAAVSVGDVVPRATHDAFVARFGIPLWQSYGASEAGPLLLNRNGTRGSETMALGRPYPEVHIDLRDEGGNPVADDAAGEIVAFSPAVGLGYLGTHDGASSFVGREFHTGDLALRRDGDIHFAGRRKVLITRAGRKIDPAEIERVLRTHPGVLDAAVRVAGDTGHDPLQALVVTRHSVAAQELIEHCARSLEAHKVPRRIEFRGTLPRDGTGKLQRDRLQTW
jgi:acyl-CoA synthetase (AMP-forming)/AMP-acid ligase II